MLDWESLSSRSTPAEPPVSATASQPPAHNAPAEVSAQADHRVGSQGSFRRCCTAEFEALLAMMTWSGYTVSCEIMINVVQIPGFP